MSKPKNWHSIPEYNAFRAMMQAGTTTDASRRLDISQSAVSRAIGSLEARLGIPLFEREAGRLRPTQEALRFNRRLDPLFEALDRLDDVSEPVQETLRLIAPPTFAHRFLVSSIGSFLKSSPNFFVSFEVANSEDVVRGVLENRFDLGITGVEQNRAGVKLATFRRSQAVCAMQRDHPLSGRDEIRPEDLNGEKLVALSYRHARRRQLDRVLQQVRADVDIVAEVSTSFAAADLVKEGLGVTVINPFPLYHYRSSDLAFVPFKSTIRYQSYFVTSDDRPIPRIARAFMRHMRLSTPPDPFSERS